MPWTPQSRFCRVTGVPLFFEWAPSDRFGRGRYVGKTAWPAFPLLSPSAHVFTGDENGGR